MKFSARRIIIFFLIFLFCLSPLIPLAHAQIINQTSSTLSPNTNPDVPKNLHTHTQSVMIEVMASMICQLTGKDVINRNQTCLGIDQQTGKIGFTKSTEPGKIGGAIGMTTDVIAMTYTPPLHTGDYFSYLAQNFGITKTAYAQTRGTGFDGLKPVMDLWIAFRNLVYFFFIAVFIILGFGIMLRVHMDPRTVMTISNQLPGIIVAILLVTFSFAISGFLIDLMWTSIYVTSNVITSVNKDDNFQKAAQGVVQSTNVFEAANAIGGMNDKFGGLARIADNPADAFADQMDPLIKGTGLGGELVMAYLGGVLGSHIKDVVLSIGKGAGKLANSTISLISLRAGSFLENLAKTIGGVGSGASMTPHIAAASAIANAISGIAGAAVGYFFKDIIAHGIIQMIAWLVIAIAILWALFRLAFELIKSYIFILLDVVFAPFWILGGLIPGSPIGFGAWLKEIISHLSVFPVTIGMFLLGSTFMKAFGTTTNPNQFTPPMIGNSNAEGFASFIGLGIILMTPQVLTMMKELIKAPSFKQTGAIAGAIGYGLGAVNIPQHMQKLGQFGYYAGQLKHFPGLKGAFGRAADEVPK